MINVKIRFGCLETELQDLPQRQRSLQSVFNHSWRLLSESEREILEALSVFRGSFTRESAHKAAGASLGDLISLIHKSIIHHPKLGQSDPRFDVYFLYFTMGFLSLFNLSSG